MNLRGRPKCLQLDNNQKLPLIEAPERDVATFTLKRLEQKKLRPTKNQYRELILESLSGSPQGPSDEDDLKTKTSEELRAMAVKELSRTLARAQVG